MDLNFNIIIVDDELKEGKQNTTTLDYPIPGCICAAQTTEQRTNIIPTVSKASEKENRGDKYIMKKKNIKPCKNELYMK